MNMIKVKMILTYLYTDKDAMILTYIFMEQGIMIIGLHVYG